MNDNTERTIVAKRLVGLRKERGLSSKTVAELIGIPHENYRKYETKIYPKIEVIVKLADFYNVTADYLMGRTDSRQSVDNSPEKRFVLHQEKQEYKVIENDIESLSEFEIMAIRKMRSVSNEDKAKIVELLTNLKDAEPHRNNE